MTTLTASRATTSGRRSRRAGAARVGLWAVRIALAAQRLAAVGLVGLMVGAAVTNVVALQTSPAVPMVLLTLALLVAVTRTGKGSGR